MAGVRYARSPDWRFDPEAHRAAYRRALDLLAAMEAEDEEIVNQEIDRLFTEAITVEQREEGIRIDLGPVMLLFDRLLAIAAGFIALHAERTSESTLDVLRQIEGNLETWIAKQAEHGE